MTLLAPLGFLFGVVGALGVVALHFLTVRRPPRLVLPTARFVPASEARAVSRTSRPTDILLLVLRALAVLLIGLAFARPVIDAPGPSVRSVVAVDISRSVADLSAAVGLARNEVGVGGALIVFDSSAREIDIDDLTEYQSQSPGQVAVGLLSPVFPVAQRAAARIARGADSVRLVIVTSLADGSIDAATPALRSEWPGRVDIVAVQAAVDTAGSATPEIVTQLEDDPLLPAVSASGVLIGDHRVRIQRGVPTREDSAWAGSGRNVLVIWPAIFDGEVSPLGVTTFGVEPVTLVAPLARLEVAGNVVLRPGFAGDDSVGQSESADRHVLARWSDASPAITEGRSGEGCVRDVGVGVPLSGDLTLRPNFVRFLSVVLEPCGGRLVGPAVQGDLLPEWLAEDRALAAAGVLASVSGAGGERLPAWLLAGALALLMAEFGVRRYKSRRGNE